MLGCEFLGLLNVTIILFCIRQLIPPVTGLIVADLLAVDSIAVFLDEHVKYKFSFSEALLKFLLSGGQQTVQLKGIIYDDFKGEEDIFEKTKTEISKYNITVVTRMNNEKEQYRF